MRCRRSLAAFAVAVLLINYSGCGGGDKETAANDSAASTAAPAGTKPNKKTKKKTERTSMSASKGGTIEVSCVTPDDFAAIVIHPRRIVETPLVAEQLKAEPIAGAIKKSGIDPSELEQIVVLMSMDEKRGGPAEPVVVARFTHDVDAKEVLTKFVAAMSPRGPPTPIKEVEVGGKTCFDLGPGGAPLAYAPAKNVIVLANKNQMMTVLSATGKGPLVERLKKAETDNDIIVALEPGAIADFEKMVDAAKRGAQGSPLDLEVAKAVQGGTVTLSLSGPSILHATFDAKTAEGTDKIEKSLRDALILANGGLAAAKQSVPKQAQAAFGPLFKLGEEILDGAKTSKSGSQVMLDVKRPDDLDTIGPAISGAIRQYFTLSQSSGLRMPSMNKMRQIALAMLNYETTFRHFPPAAIEKNGKPLLSWRVALLPFMEQDSLYKQFHLDEAWDSPHNLPLAKMMPSEYQSPDSPNNGKTRIMVFVGKGAGFQQGKSLSMNDITDGSSNTILCVEAGPDKAVPWTKPEDLPFDPEMPLEALGHVSPEGFLAAMFDGSVHQLKVDNQTLKALITPNGNEPIDRAKVFAEDTMPRPTSRATRRQSP